MAWYKGFALVAAVVHDPSEVGMDLRRRQLDAVVRHEVLRDELVQQLCDVGKVGQLTAGAEQCAAVHLSYWLQRSKRFPGRTS